MWINIHIKPYELFDFIILLFFLTGRIGPKYYKKLQTLWTISRWRMESKSLRTFREPSNLKSTTRGGFSILNLTQDGNLRFTALSRSVTRLLWFLLRPWIDPTLAHHKALPCRGFKKRHHWRANHYSVKTVIATRTF